MAKQKFHDTKLFQTGLRLSTKLKMLQTYVWSIMKYGSETWGSTQAIKDRVNAFEMWCYRRILKIPYTAHRTNVDVLQQLRTDMKLNTIIDRQRLRYIGHVLRGSSGSELRQLLVDTLSQKNVGRGRRKTFWFDDAWKIVANDANRATKLTLLIKRAGKRDLWRQSVWEYTAIEPTLNPEDGPT